MVITTNDAPVVFLILSDENYDMNQNKRKGDGFMSDQPAKKSMPSEKRNTSNRIIHETRIFLNKSNSKCVVISISPEHKIFDVDVWLGERDVSHLNSEKTD